MDGLTELEQPDSGANGCWRDLAAVIDEWSGLQHGRLQRRENRLEFRCRTGSERVDPPRAAHFRADQPMTLEVGQLLRGANRANAENGFKVTHAQRPLGEEGEDSQAIQVRQAFEQIDGLLGLRVGFESGHATWISICLDKRNLK